MAQNAATAPVTRGRMASPMRGRNPAHAESDLEAWPMTEAPQESASTVEQSWPRFVHRVFAGRLVARRTFARAGRELTAFDGWTWADVREPNLSRLIEHAISNGRRPADDDLVAYARWGAMRADHSVPIDEVIHIFHLYRSELARRLAQVASESEAGFRLRFTELSSEWLEQGAITALKGHRDALADPLILGVDERLSLLRLVLLDGSSAREAAGEFKRFGLDATRAFHTVRARPTPAVSATALRNYLAGASGGHATVLVGSLYGDVCGLVEQLPTDGCTALVPIGVSGAAPVAQLSQAFNQASRAHVTALALGRSGIFDLTSLGIYPSVLSDEDVGRAMIARYITPLVRLGSSGEDILRTVDHYMRADRVLATSASELFLHVNSVRYRLRKFEEITNCSLKSNDTVAELWWALARWRMLSA